MKKIKLLIAILAVTVISQSGNAQSSISGFAQRYNHSGVSSSFGLGGTYNYAIENRNRKTKLLAYAGLNFTLPGKSEFQVSASGSDSSSIEVDAKETRTVAQLMVGAKFYIIGQTDSKFGLYFNFGSGYMIQPAKLEFGDYDRNTYTVDSYEEYKETLNDLFFDLGFGVDFDMNFSRLFVSANLIAPPNNKNGEAYVSTLEGGTSIRVGLRFDI